MIYIGIDPGVSGGIAAVDELGIVVGLTKMPATDRDIVDFLKPYRDRMPPPRAMLERVRTHQRMGVVSAFTFGGIYRALRIALVALDIRFDEVQPKVWQQSMGVMYPKGETRDKNITKARAQQVYPGLTITHATADALLIAEHCRRTTRGERHGEEGKGTIITRQGPRDSEAATGRDTPRTRTAVSGASRHGAGTKRPA